MKDKDLKFSKLKKRSTKNSVYALSPTGVKEIKAWKPNVFQRFMYCTGLMKYPRYNGKKRNYYHFDEVGQMDSKHLQGTVIFTNV